MLHLAIATGLVLGLAVGLVAAATGNEWLMAIASPAINEQCRTNLAQQVDSGKAAAYVPAKSLAPSLLLKELDGRSVGAFPLSSRSRPSGKLRARRRQ